MCQKQVSGTGTSNSIPQYQWDIITRPCPRYPLLAHKSTIVFLYLLVANVYSFGQRSKGCVFLKAIYFHRKKFEKELFHECVSEHSHSFAREM